MVDETGCPASDLDRVGFLLGRAYYSYIGLLERMLAETGLDAHCKPGMGSLLFALYQGDDRPMSEVARELRVAKSTMTGMAAQLKNAGLITTRRDERDRRVVRLRLTPLARSLEARCRDLAARIEAAVCERLDAAQRAQLKTLLTTVTETLSDSLARGGAEPESGDE